MKVADLYALLSFKTDKRTLTKALGDTKKLARESNREFKKMATQTEGSFKRVGRTISGVMRKAKDDARQLLSMNRGRAADGKFTKAGFGQKLINKGKQYGGLAITAGFALGTRDALGFTEALGRLNITAKGGLGTLSQLKDRILDVSNETGVGKSNVLGAVSKYIELTGNAKAAAANMELFAKVQQATGASGDDVAGSAAAFVDQFKIAAPEMEKMFSIAIEGGKAGAVEFRQMAAELAAIGAESQKFASSTGLGAAAEISAALQIITATTGGNVSEASTQLRGLFKGLGEGADKLKEHGIKVFDATGEYRAFADIMREIKDKNLSAKQLEEIFPNVRASRGAMALLRGEWDALTEATLASNAVSEDYAEIMKNSAIKVKKAWNRFKNFMLVGFAKVVDAMGWLVDHSRLIVIAITVLIGAFISLKAAAIAAAIQTAAAWVVAMAPLILMGLLIAAIILLVEDIWVAFKGGESITGAAYEWLVDVFVKAIEEWEEQLTKFFKWVEQKFDNLKVLILDAKSMLPGGGESETSRRARAALARQIGASHEDMLSSTEQRQEAQRRKDVYNAMKDASVGIFEAGNGVGLFRQNTPMMPIPGAGRGAVSSSVQINVAPGASLDRTAVPEIRRAAAAGLEQAARQAETESY